MPDVHRISILVVEDEDTWIDLYQDMLEEVYTLTLARSLEEAEAALEKAKFDLAVVDPGLDRKDNSNLDGVKIIRKIVTSYSPLPIIVVTGDEKRVRDNAPKLKDFVDVFIEKTNLNKRNLIETIETLHKKDRAKRRWLNLSRQSSGMSVYDTLRQILAELRDLTDADVAHLLAPAENDDELVIIADTGEDEGRMIPIKSISGRAYHQRKPIDLKEKAYADSDYVVVKGPQGMKEMESELAVPVQSGDRIIGVLNIESAAPNAFDSRHQKLVKTFAVLAVLMTQGERRQKDLDELHKSVGELLESVLDLNEIKKSILKRGSELVDAKSGFLAIKVNGHFRIDASIDHYHEGQILDIDSTIAGNAIQVELPQRIDDVRNDERVEPFRHLLDLTKLSVLAVPIELDNNIIGVLNFESDRANAFSIEEQTLIFYLANYASLAIRMAQQAQELADSKGKQQQSILAAKLVHSVGNPIHNIRDWLTEINETELSKLQKDYPDIALALSQIEPNIRQLTKVVAQVRQILQPKPRKPTKIETIVQSAFSELRSSHGDKDINTDIDISPDIPMISADETLQEVLLELIYNSVEASAEKVQIKAYLDQDEVKILVIDNGSGIDPRHHSRVFEPLFTTKKRGEGDGLGLFWCKWYTEHCGGNLVLIDSEVGKGSTFGIFLPVYVGPVRSIPEQE